MQALRRWKVGTRARLLFRGYPELWPYAGIDGWLSIDEAITLYELARQLRDDGPVVVEIGCWQGKSSVVLGRGLRDKRDPMLFCIDPFSAEGDAYSEAEYREREPDAGSLQERFLANLEDAGVRDFVTVHRGYSYDAALEFRRQIDLLFLDGDHAYEAVARDFVDWSPRLRAGGWLCMHDVGHPDLQGPRRVADERVRGSADWEDVRMVDSLLIARRRR